uniref:Uncharacterized protein n=1 Tax=Caenorhabditis japonica TaxID=281687 RepID=A0A8R1I5T2_CAEJA
MAYQGATIVAAPNEFRTPFPPFVQVSKVQFQKEGGSRLLAASGWDGALRVYDVGKLGEISEKLAFSHGKPLLATTFALIIDFRLINIAWELNEDLEAPPKSGKQIESANQNLQ